MDFALPPEIEALRRRIADFVAAEIMPLEADGATSMRISRCRYWKPCAPKSGRPGFGRPRCRASWAVSA